jgi:2-polyprenyl-3-methyl-5-hydroxy-6-metoxy-1,4-benzoquinol methylase
MSSTPSPTPDLTRFPAQGDPQHASWDAFWRDTPVTTQRMQDAAALADAILLAVGQEAMLDVGCGDGLLLHELLRKGVDARGIDTSPIAVRAARLPDRVKLDDFRDVSSPAPVVLAIDVLHHLPEADVLAALQRLARLASRAILLRISTRADRPRHLTQRPREWWQSRCFEAGLRTHPRASTLVAYNKLDAEMDSHLLLLEPLPTVLAAQWPLERLHAAKQLHMDMLREPGRRADAHLARYALAASLVRPGDVILDAACGLGYGSHLLAHLSAPSRIEGIDTSADAIAYATAAFTHGPTSMTFTQCDATRLAHLPDASVDLVVSFETLEHVPDPKALLAEFARVLTPGGRLIASVPNLWTDESGKDPNPHHLHAYDWDLLARQVRDTDRGALLIERAIRQTAGGGMPQYAHLPRQLQDAPTTIEGALPETTIAPEWWLVVAMKDPARGAGVPYTERTFVVDAEHAGNVVAYARDYDNPWLVRAMVNLGHRAASPALLAHLARHASTHSRPGSADQGAAWCVRAYQALENSSLDPSEASAVLAGLQAFDQRAGPSHAVSSPHALRWRCSNAYVEAKLHLAIGNMHDAEQAFERCASIDVLAFSPLLATKTVDARFQLGVLAASRQDLRLARDHWFAGITEAQRVTHVDWRDVIADPARPLPFGLPELSAVLDAASRCAWALGLGDRWLTQPGFALANSLPNAAHTRAVLAKEVDHLRRAWRDQQSALARAATERDAVWRGSEQLRMGFEEQAKNASEAQSQVERLHAAYEEQVANARSSWDQQQQAIRSLEEEKYTLWQESRRLAEAWQQQQRAVASLEADKQSLWQESERLKEEKQRLWEDSQRLAQAWQAQQAALESIARDRDHNWQESQRLAAEWERQRQYIERIEVEHAQQQAALNTRLTHLEAQHAALADALAHANTSRADIQSQHDALRAALGQYREGIRYRALRALRVVHPVP